MNVHYSTLTRKRVDAVRFAKITHVSSFVSLTVSSETEGEVCIVQVAHCKKAPKH